mgnify:CR=1 FL=1
MLTSIIAQVVAELIIIAVVKLVTKWISGR